MPGAVVKTFLAGLPLEALLELDALLAGCFRFREAVDVDGGALVASSALVEKEEVPGMESLSLSLLLSLSLAEADDE